MLLESSNPTRPFRDEGIVLGALLAVAAFDVPYGYYQFLRIAVSIGGIILAIQRRKGWLCLFGIAVAILFNPIWPVHFTRESWRVLDVSLAVIFVLIGLAVRDITTHPEEEFTEGSLNGPGGAPRSTSSDT